MVNWSIINIEDLSIAKGNSHESFSIFLASRAIHWVFGFLGRVEPFLNFSFIITFIDNSVCDLFLLNFSESIEFVHCRLSDRDNVL